MTVERFPNAVSSVAKARHMVSGLLAEAPSEARDAAEMLVSEVVTNCVRHTSSDFMVSVEITDDVIRVEVTDWGAGDPIVKHPAPSEPNGRGLQIVEMLASRWGIEPVGSAGKTVWFEILLQTA